MLPDPAQNRVPARAHARNVVPGREKNRNTNLMLIHPPLCITSRLLPGLVIGGKEISIEYAPRPGREGRTRYRYHIGDHTGDDLQSGCQGGSLQRGLESLLSFLGSPSDSDGDLFPPEIVEWARQNSDEIGMAQIELSETPNLIEE